MERIDAATSVGRRIGVLAMKRAHEATAMLCELHGNPSRRPMPANEPERVGDLWTPPAWFDEEQQEQWHCALHRAPPGLLTGTDRPLLGLVRGLRRVCARRSRGPQSRPGG